MVNYNYVFFYSEGLPNDKGLALGDCKDKLIEAAKDHVDNISYYTPKILEDMGYGEYVKNYEDKGLCTKNPGMNNIGFEAWKPLILLLEFEKMNEGDILIYRDSNIITKNNDPFKVFENIKSDVAECLDIYNFDFCIPRQNDGYPTYPYVKTNILKELGENHQFTFKFPLLSCHQFFMRKSDCVLELLKEWEKACLKEEWRNGNKYGELHEGFKWSTNAQAILCCIIANWVRKRKYNIPLDYPKLYFPKGDLTKRLMAKNFSYLNFLNNEKINAKIINLKIHIEKYKDISEKLNQLNFCNYSRFDAVLGQDVFNKLLEENKIYKINNRMFLNNMMVGCWQSHYIIWKNMIDNNIEKLLIMEDDCVFKENFVEKFNRTMELIKDKYYEILYLGYSGTNVIFDKELHLLDYGCPRTTHCYILTLDGAKKLVDKLSRINYPIDELMGGMFNKKELIGYRTSELLVWQPWQYSRSLSHRKKYFNI